MSSTNITISTEPIILDVKEFTNNVEIDTNTYTVNGDGIFDILMMTATKHLVAQYKANRIRQEDYANAYIDLYKTTIQAALDAWLKGKLYNAQFSLIKKQAELTEKQTETENAKKDLYKRQIEGFDENYKEKILKIMLDAWGIGFSVAKDSFDAQGIPAPMQKLSIDDVFNKFVVPELDSYKYGRNEGVTPNNPTP